MPPKKTSPTRERRIPSPQALFKQALRDALELRDVPQTTLSETLGVSKSTVSMWLQPDGGVPVPSMVFLIEEKLGIQPGSLSRYLGYVPAANAPPRLPAKNDWLTLLLADDNITPQTRAQIKSFVDLDRKFQRQQPKL